jgi:hypothetical protein
MTTSGLLVESAEGYLARGWSPIPIERVGKRPLIKWTVYQKFVATVDEVRGWWKRWPDANVGIVTGRVSGIVVLDVDGKRGDQSLGTKTVVISHTVVALTGNGLHYFFKHPGANIPTRAGILPGLDIRGDGGYVVVPPSIHSSGRRYSWGEHSNPADVDIAPLPEWLVGMLHAGGTTGTPEPWTSLLQGVAEGERNDVAARLAGRLLRAGFSATETVAWLFLWNSRNRPPLPENEILAVVRSIAGREVRRILG